MTMVMAVMLGLVALFVAGFVGWYMRWHHRMATALERVPVGTDRSAGVVRRGAGLPGDSIR